MFGHALFDLHSGLNAVFATQCGGNAIWRQQFVDFPLFRLSSADERKHNRIDFLFNKHRHYMNLTLWLSHVNVLFFLFKDALSTFYS